MTTYHSMPSSPKYSRCIHSHSHNHSHIHNCTGSLGILLEEDSILPILRVVAFLVPWEFDGSRIWPCSFLLCGLFLSWPTFPCTLRPFHKAGTEDMWEAEELQGKPRRNIPLGCNQALCEVNVQTLRLAAVDTPAGLVVVGVALKLYERVKKKLSYRRRNVLDGSTW